MIPPVTSGDVWGGSALGAVAAIAAALGLGAFVAFGRVHALGPTSMTLILVAVALSALAARLLAAERRAP